MNDAGAGTARERRRGTASGRGARAVLVLIVLATLALRLPHLDTLGLHGDEDISTLAARGIAEGGTPRLPSDRLYLRAPLYHGLIAPLVATGVDWAPRVLSVVASTLSVIVLVRLGRALVGSHAAWIGGALFAISVPEIATARTARMYALYELLALLAIAGLFRLWMETRVRTAVAAAVAVLVSLATHTLAATLWVLALPSLIRARSVSVRTAILVGLALFALLGPGVRKFEHGVMRSVGTWVREPPPTDAPAIAGTLRLAIARDPLALGRELLGTPGLAIVAVGFAGAAPAAIWRRPSRNETTTWATLLAMSGCATTLLAAGAHQPGLAAALWVVLLLLRPELFPGAPGLVRLRRLTAFLALASVVWLCAALFSGHSIPDAAAALTRWPGRLARAFLWPPAIACLGIPALALVIVRAMRGRASDGQRFLVLAIVLITATRGLLTPRDHARYLVEVWPLFGLLAGMTLTGLFAWAKRALRRRESNGLGRGGDALLATGAAGLVLVAPGTGVRSIHDELTRTHGQPAARGPGRHVTVADHRAACGWLSARLDPEHRVVATDWLTTYCYLGRVDGWLRATEWAKQSMRHDGAVRDVYLAAEVLPDLEHLLRFGATAPTWLLVGANEARQPRRLPPDVAAWLAGRTPAFTADDGGTRIYDLADLSANAAR